MSYHELVSDAKDLLRLLNKHDDTKSKRLFNKYMRSFRVLGAEYNDDLSTTADQSYEIKLQLFIDELLAACPSDIDEDDTLPHAPPVVEEPPAEDVDAVAINLAAEAPDGLVDEYVDMVGRFRIDEHDDDIDDYNSDSDNTNNTTHAASARNDSPSDDAGDADEYQFDSLVDDHAGEEVEQQPAPKKKRKKKGSGHGRKKGGKQGTNTYTKVPDNLRKRQPARARPSRKATSTSTLAEVMVDEVDINKASQADLRRLVSMFYVHVLRAPPPEDWNGKGGTVSDVIKGLRLRKGQRRTVHNVLVQTHHCLTTGKVYDGERKASRGATAIKPGTKVEQLVADYRERGLSLTETTILINEWCKANNEPFVTRSAVDTCEKSLNPLRTKTGKRPQGSKDRNSTWARCRHRWVAQLLIRMGRGDEVNLNDFIDEKTQEVEECFNIDNLTVIDLAAVAWWDEMHKDCFIGDFREGAEYQLRFKRSDDGKLNMDDGEYREEKLELQVKYAKQVRFSFGVAMKGEEGSETGHRLEPYDYTGKMILTMPKFEKMIQEEIKRVKNLPRNSKGWNSNQRAANALYRDDSVTKVNRLGTVSAGLLEPHGISVVSDLLALKDDDGEYDNDTIKKIVKETKGVGKDGLIGWIDYCHANIVEGEVPDVEYYIDAANPYEAKYGTELNEWGEPAWRDAVKKASALSGHACVSDLVKHIVLKTKECYEGTEHEDTYWFYHDALSQLTHDSCVDWMQKTKIPGESKCIYDRWIKPECELNDAFGKKWRRRPIGNSPELMPLDNHLNQDIHMSVRKHVAMCLGVVLENDKDERVFSLSTPKAAQSAYLRVFHPTKGVAPTSDRIVQDIKRVITSMNVIYKEGGVFVPGLSGGRTPGGRWTATTEKTSNNHGGKRTRGEGMVLKDEERHEDLKSLIDESGDITEYFVRNMPNDDIMDLGTDEIVE